MDLLLETQAGQVAMTPENLVQAFKTRGMLTSTRNKLGNVIWPVARKYFQGCMLLSIPMLFIGTGGPLVALGAMGAAYGFQKIVNSHIKFLQNMSLSNATLFGRMMKGQNVPEIIRQKAMELFLKETGPWFTARGYIRHNPDNMKKLIEGETVPKIPTVMGNAEARLNRLDRIARKQGRIQAPFRERFKAWRDAFRDAFRSETEGKKKFALLQERFEQAQEERQGLNMRLKEAAAEKRAPAPPLEESIKRTLDNTEYTDLLVNGERISSSARQESFSVTEKEIKTKSLESTSYFAPDRKRPVAHSFKNERHFIDRRTGEKEVVTTESESVASGLTLSRTENSKTGEVIFREQHPLSHQEWIFDGDQQLTSEINNQFETPNNAGEYKQTDYTYDGEGHLAHSTERTSIVTPDGETTTVVHRGPDGKEITAENLSAVEMAKKRGIISGRG